MHFIKKKKGMATEHRRERQKERWEEGKEERGEKKNILIGQNEKWKEVTSS